MKIRYMVQFGAACSRYFNTYEEAKAHGDVLKALSGQNYIIREILCGQA